MSLLNKLRSKIALGLYGTLLVRVGSLGLQFIISVLLARFLAPAGYGEYAYALAWVMLLAVPCKLGFEKLLVREVAIANREKEYARMRRMVRWTSLAALSFSVVAAILFVAVIWAFGLSDSRGKLLALAMASPMIPIFVITELRSSALAGLKRVVIGQLPESLFRPIVFIGILLTLGSGFSSAGAIAANASAAFVAALIGQGMLMKCLPAAQGGLALAEEKRAWLRSGIPLMALAIMQTASQQVSILFLGVFSSSDQVGLFAIASRLASLGGFILLAFNAVLAPRIAELYSGGEMTRLQNLVTMSSLVITMVSAPVFLVFILKGDWLLLFLFGEAYVPAHRILAILAVGSFFNCAMGSVGLLLTMTRNEQYAVRGIVISLSMGILLNALLIPRYGAEGAAIAAAASLVIWNIIFFVFIYRKLNIVASFFAMFLPGKIRL